MINYLVSIWINKYHILHDRNHVNAYKKEREDIHHYLLQGPIVGVS